MTTEHRWGDPGEPGSKAEAAWRKANIVTIHVAGIALTVHRELAVIFTVLCAHLVSEGHVNLAAKADDWGWANRNVRGGHLKSFHATGQAIDLDATTNPMGQRKTTFPIALMRRLCAALGLRWGFDYTGRPDAMHVEFIGTVDDARKITARLTKKPQPIKTAVRKAVRAVRRNPFPQPKRLLLAGSVGADVQWLQWALGLKTDGKYGPVTYRAVLAYQRKRYLDPDGKAGPRTVASLAKVTH